MFFSRSTSLIAFSVACLLFMDSPLFATESEGREAVRNILLRNLHSGDPSHARQVSNLASKGLGRKQVALILIENVEERCPLRAKSAEDRTLCRRSIISLGDLEVEEAFLALSAAAETDDSAIRNAAVRAIASLHGSGAMKFAKRVVVDHGRFDYLDRDTLYRRLGSRLEAESDAGQSESRESVRRLLLESAFFERHPSNLRLIDEALKGQDVRYRTSFEREAFLETIRSSSLERHREYAARELMLLRRTPASERTHVSRGE